MKSPQNDPGGKIYFQSRGDPEYRFLSNFYESPFDATILGLDTVDIIWKTVEHYFQASKATSFEDMMSVAIAKSARDAQKIGRMIKCRQNWDVFRMLSMEFGVRAKFDQNDELKRRLLDTGDRELVEYAPWGDVFWGVNSKLEGQNNLGKILMRVRDELRGERKT